MFGTDGYVGWVDSPGHCANLMNPAFTYLGNGYAKVPDSRYVHYWTQNFAAPQPGMLFAPDAPRITSITAGDRQLTVNFTPPAWNGGRPIVTYLYSIDGGATWVPRSPAAAGSPLVISGLTIGTAYQVRLQAANDQVFTVGASLGSNTVSGTPKVTISVPGAPVLNAVTPADSSAWVAWTPGSSGGLTISNYEYTLDGGGSWTAFSPAVTTSPALIPGLTNGSQYTVGVRAVNDRGAGAGSATAAVTPMAPVPSVFVPISPARVVDTRPSEGGTPLGAGETRTFSVADQITIAGGAKDVVPVGATAIAYNITYPAGTQPGHFRVMPGDVAATNSSALNFLAGLSIANGSVVGIDDARRIRVFNATGVAQNAIIDVVGYFVAAEGAPDGGKLTPVSPVRVYDSDAKLSSGGDADGWLPAGQTLEVDVSRAMESGDTVVPAGSTALGYNITIFRPAGGGHLRVFPGDQSTLPGASTINFGPGDVVANGTVVKLSPTGTVKVYNGSATDVRFLIDVVGYYRSDTGSVFYPSVPARVYDSRSPEPAPGSMASGQPSRVISVADSRDADGAVIARSVVPTEAVAIAYNLGVTNTVNPGHLRLFPAGETLPNASVINWPGRGYTRANASVVGVSADKKVAIYSSEPGTHVFMDVLGYYGP